MITKLEVKNWKSFGEASLYVDPITILIGTNSSGKSNLLEALLFLAGVAKGKDFDDLFKDKHYDGAIRGNPATLINMIGHQKTFVLTAHLTINDIDYQYSIECEEVSGRHLKLVNESLSYKRDSNDVSIPVFKIIDRLVDSINVEVAEGEKPGSWSGLWYDSNKALLYQLRKTTLSSSSDQHIIPIIDFLSSISLADPLPHRMRTFSQLSDELLPDSSNLAGVLASLSGQQSAKVSSVLTSYIDQLSEKDIKKVWAESVGVLAIDAMLYIEENFAGQKETIIDARSASDGTLHLLGVMTALLVAPEKSLLIIEEIDKGLHPSRTSLLVKFLFEIGKERKVDIICTTHNPALLDAFGNQMIAFMSVVHRDPATGMSKVTLIEEIEHLGQLLAKGKVGRLSTTGELERALN